MGLRLMGLDYGSRTVGVAVSDPSGTIVIPLKTIFRSREGMLRKTLREIEKIVEENDICKIVIGLPLNMDGSESERAVKTREFERKLSERISVPVAFMDERLTTMEAGEILDENRVPKEGRKKIIDSLAAQLILESYLHSTE